MNNICCICNSDDKIKKRKGLYYCGRHAAQLDKYKKILPRTKFEKNKIYIRDGVGIIDVYNGKHEKNGECIIDIDDIDKVKDFIWAKDKQGYIFTQIKGMDNKKHRLTMHRMLLNPKKDELTDHINLNKSDNRKINLRIVDKSKNEMNKPVRKDNSLGIKGVYKDNKENSWYGELTINGIAVLKKRFKSMEEAITARKEAEKKYFGEYAFKIPEKNK